MVEGMSPVVAGIAGGALVAIASARMLQTFAFGISTADLPTLAAVSAILAGIALLACLLPAYRASRFDPVQALRPE